MFDVGVCWQMLHQKYQVLFNHQLKHIPKTLSTEIIASSLRVISSNRASLFSSFLTRNMLNPDISSSENIVDPDQLASEEAS